MAQIRVATFNVENLLQRYNFYSFGRLKKERSLELVGGGSEAENMLLRKSLYIALQDDARQMTAQAIRDTQSDIIALQEVDNREILDDFHKFYLERSVGLKYGWRRLLEGNDRRGIDVAVLSKPRIKECSHAELNYDDFDLFNDELENYKEGLSPGDRIFRRDCLEVELKVEDIPLTLFICHFKSMMGGRDVTWPVREAEAKAVRRIIENKYGSNGAANANWIILGDFNDYSHDKNGNHIPSSIEPLYHDGFSKNLLDNLDPKERWTHYFPSEKSFHQLDYIMVSPAIYQKNRQVKPDIIRSGQPYRVPSLEKVERYPRVGFDRPKASDHCPVAVTLTL